MSLSERLDMIAAALTDLEAGYAAYIAADAIVTQLEIDVAAIDGAQAVPADLGTRIADLRARVDALGGGAVPPTDPAPEPAPTRDPALWPFRIDSVWNLPAAIEVVLEATTGPLTQALRRTDIVAWANHGEWGHPITFATVGDPLASITDTNDSRRSAAGVRIPVDVAIAPGGDKHAHIVTPDRRHSHENWLFNKQSDVAYTTGRHHRVDLYGTGIGPQNGTRAYGGSAIGGLIRHHEIVEGLIPHPIAMAITDSQLFYDSAASQPNPWGYDSNGFGRAKGYVWPATEQDHNSPSNYKGIVPMGTYVVLDPAFDIDGSGLTASGKVLARAFQDYGGYVTDRSSSFSMAYIENVTARTPTDVRDKVTRFMNDILGPSWTAADLKTIRAHLRVVTNNSPLTPNGGVYTGNASNRRAALAPIV